MEENAVLGLIQRVREKDRRSLARLITHVENGEHLETIRQQFPTHDPRRSMVIGLTGSPGAGKSTLTATLVGHLRSIGRRVAVLATDPASPFTGGALLGDRVRIDFDPADRDVFVRSFSSRGATGGLSECVSDVIRLVEASGFEVILVETVGSGQDQLAVRDLADVLVVVLTPAGGDDIQWEKAGQMEAADVIALNKADLPGADFALAGLRAFFELSPSTAPPIVRTKATQGEGVAELWTTIEETFRRGSYHPRFAASRRLLAAAQRELKRLFDEFAPTDEGVKKLIDSFASGDKEDHLAARALIEHIARRMDQM